MRGRRKLNRGPPKSKYSSVPLRHLGDFLRDFLQILLLKIVLRALFPEERDNFRRSCRRELRCSGLVNTSYGGADFSSSLKKNDYELNHVAWLLSVLYPPRFDVPARYEVGEFSPDTATGLSLRMEHGPI